MKTDDNGAKEVQIFVEKATPQMEHLRAIVANAESRAQVAFAITRELEKTIKRFKSIYYETSYWKRVWNAIRGLRDYNEVPNF